MAVSVAAGDKQHGDRSDARHEKRIVIGAADHGDEIQPVVAAGLGKRIEIAGAQSAGASAFSSSVLNSNLPRRSRLISRFRSRLLA